MWFVPARPEKARDELITRCSRRAIQVLSTLFQQLLVRIKGEAQCGQIWMAARVGVNMAAAPDNVRKFINTCAAKAMPFSPFVALVWSGFFLGKDNFGVDELRAELHFFRCTGEVVGLHW